MHGYGVYTWKNGRKFEGNFEYNKRSGRGIQTWPDGRVYDGEWLDGK